MEFLSTKTKNDTLLNTNNAIDKAVKMLFIS